MRRRRLLAAVLVLVVLWLVVVAALLIDAARSLQHGRDKATTALHSLDASNVLDDKQSARLAAAAKDLRHAHHALHNPLLTPVRLLPVAGRQLRSVDASAATAGTVASVAERTLRDVSRLANDRKSTGADDRIRLVDSLHRSVIDARRELDGLHLGPNDALIGPIRTVHNDLARRLTDARTTLRDADVTLTAIRSVLAGPSSYLVVAANNAEMRAGSGMWLQGGVLTTKDGHFELATTRPLYLAAPPPAGLPIGDTDLDHVFGWLEPQTEWRNLMPSPRLAASAQLAQRMWSAAGKPPVKGVIVLDAVGLGGLIRATGNVEVNGRTYDGDSIVKELLHDQYTRYTTASSDDIARREALSSVAAAVFNHVDAGQWTTAELGKQMAAAVRARHLLVWSSDPTEERGWRAAGAAGELTDRSLAVSLLNRGGNKLDWFTTATGSLEAKRAGADTLITATIDVTNHAAPGEPTYIEGPYSGADTVAGEYKAIVVVDVPKAARDITLSGTPPDLRGEDGSAQLIGGTIRIRRGATRTVTVTFRMPGHAGRLQLEPSARAQPIRWKVGGRELLDDRPRSVRW